ncbi:MAG: retropepsin-like aspartic protease family protein [Hyphomicrobium sp.]
MSSGIKNLFASVALFVMVAVGGAWALKHPDRMVGLVETATGIKLASLAERPLGGTPETNSSDGARTSSSAEGDGDMTIQANDNGHFETEIEINGRSIDVMVDTGATLVALTYEDAERAGLFLSASDFTHGVRTANGVAKVAPVQLDEITLGDITVRNVRGAVSEPGKLHKTLLGMSFLGRLTRVDMRANALVLHE